MNVLLVCNSKIISSVAIDLLRRISDKINIRTIENRSCVKDLDMENEDIVFLHINNDILNSKEILNILQNKGNKKVIILDFKKDKNFFIETVGVGVDGYIGDLCDNEYFLFNIKKLIQGKKFYDIDLVKSTLNFDKLQKIKSITKREEEVIKLICEGFTNEEIGENLHISKHTVKKYISSILFKLDLKNRKEVIIHMIENY